MENSVGTVRHIKQVASDQEVTQINLMCHQCTDLPASKHKKKSFVKPRPPSYKNDASDRHQVPSYHNNNYKKNFDAKNVYKNKERCKKCGDSMHIEVSSKEVLVQVFPQVWTLYKLMLSKETSFFQA